ncbi:iron-containing redox enzyme family protein [Verrucomicrobium sp. BvORR106]|uniref:TenA family transcriptional regulator n=1 Tax=Verrucomicrobium sp. BvORR106 TaxID=1403819 RepID=UPI00068E2BF0|nr:iron-containing redox enzyme family protein [Verrucomicrobium sp. BvORR106]
MSAGSIGSPVDHPPSLATAPHILAAARAVLVERPIISQSYFTRLRDGSMSHAEFVRSQQQFYFAVRYFSRPIAALVSRCPDSTMRMNLVENLAEEQGGFLPSHAHDRTFLSFLESLGSTAPNKEGAEVQAFNCALLGVCLGEELETAFACLGIIELAFADISAWIGSAVVDRGWIAPDRLVHYALHAELDHRHAEECFVVIEPRWEESLSRRQSIQRGLELGRHLFSRLYLDLDALNPAQADG